MKKLQITLKLLLLLHITVIKNQDIAYNYLQGGSDWTGACQTGQKQSPIDIEFSQLYCDGNMKLKMFFVNEDIENVIIDYPIPGENTIQKIQTDIHFSDLYGTDINTELWPYEARSFQIHAPSEHTILGQQFDLELHIMHELQDIAKDQITPEELAEINSWGIISILFELVADEDIEDTTMTFFHPSRFDMSKIAEPIPNFNVLNSLGDLYDMDQQFYFYEGSSTYPPCEENINWYILLNQMPILQSQLDDITRHLAGNPEFANGRGNNRNLQEINERLIKVGGSACPETYPSYDPQSYEIELFSEKDSSSPILSYKYSYMFYTLLIILIAISKI